MTTGAKLHPVAVQRSDVRLEPDPSRVVARLFVAGQELTSGRSRASPVMLRVLRLGNDEVDALLARTLARFGDRHHDLPAVFLENFERVRDRLGTSDALSRNRCMLLGAYATNEFAVEAAALCNPSIVAHPDQRGAGPGELRFVLSLRAVGEGHISSIEFRTGFLDAAGAPRLDDPGPQLVTGQVETPVYERDTFRKLLDDDLAEHEIVNRTFDRLAATFSAAELEATFDGLDRRDLARRDTGPILQAMRTVAASNYTRIFPSATDLGQRVLQPHGPSESNGMEDARWVRFCDDDGTVTYLATYTAFDGGRIAPQMISTADFETFVVSQLAGQAATNKGMAIFPRRIDGRYVALSRWDRVSISLATSGDGHRWDDPRPVHAPQQAWELIQVGNCGAPIETPAGWLVLTHGVGPMRTYSLGALLLDLDDPGQVIGSLADPLLTPGPGEQEGYVPNVVYTCGALLHGEVLVLPYAYGDRVTTFATVALADLLTALR